MTATLLSKASSENQHTDTIAECSNLTTALEKLVKFLEHDASNLLSESRIRDYMEQARDMLEKSRHTGSSIVIGLIGGTGVGKSTLINALAGEEVSTASDRRPFTDRAVIYRHRDQNVSFEKRDDLFKHPDATHVIDSIKDILIIDMPDFDSYDRGNVRTVMELMPSLDMVLWVVSPEKYADASFFDFVKGCHAHQSNFSFVFNKSDQLIDGNSPDRYSKLKEALGDFVFQLKAQTGISNPRVFSVSSYLKLSGLSEDQFLADEFSGLREFIMANRRAKEIQSIKFLNLLSQSTILFQEVFTNAQPDLKRRTIHRISELTNMDRGFESFSFSDSSRKKISSDIFKLLTINDASVPSIQLAINIMAFRWNKNDPVLTDRILSGLGEKLLDLGRPYFESLRRVRGRVDSESLLGLTDTITQQDPDNFEVILSEPANQSVSNLTKILDLNQSKVGSFFLRLSQRLLLLIPVALLVVRLLADDNLHGLFREVDIHGFLWGLVVLASQIFSPQGLSSLMTLVVLETGLIIWLANRRIKKMKKKSLKLTDVLLKEYQNSLESFFRRITQSIDVNLNQISKALDELEAIEKLFVMK